MTISNPPEGYQTVTPYVVVTDLDAELLFLDRVFGITVRGKLLDAEGKSRHAEVLIGSSMIMLGQAPDPSPGASLYVYVDDADTVHQKALEQGATEIIPPTNMFYGDRQSGVTDPAGNQWWIASRIENVSREEMQRRASAHWT